MRSFQPLFITLILLGIAFQGCASPPLSDLGCKPPSHDAWTALLRAHVDTKGHVSYKGLKKDVDRLDAYLRTLSDCPPSKDWSRDERLAYWVNAYNAFTVKLIIDHYPVKSIKEIGPRLSVPLVNSVWDIKFFKIGGVEMNLNHIEHDILRKEFDEPRIHFAIVCASFSCPQLLNESFAPQTLEKQLHDRTVAFINDPVRNRIATDRLQLSSIFDWFKGDFTKKGTLQAFIAKYAKVKVSGKAKVSYLDYDWSLNGE
ncbi:MAG: DUF547 domain-containing protein [Flavobacteriales bacterium]|nr:DUF547 domain-containing protein [Flavobacteriales bacterium]